MLVLTKPPEEKEDRISQHPQHCTVALGSMISTIQIWLSPPYIPKSYIPLTFTATPLFHTSDAAGTL